MDSPKETEGLPALRASIASIKILIQALEKALETPKFSSVPTISNPPNPLALLSDASSILKAQTTKLSLLILNKPFTPTAITFVLDSLSNECLPALMSGFELCPPTNYSQLLNQSIRTLLFRSFGGLCAILTTIPLDEKSIDKPRNHGVLALTGALWETCDSMAELAFTGLVALAVKKTDVYHGLLQDAIEELEEWDPNEETDDDDSSTDLPISTPDISNNKSGETPRQTSQSPVATVSLPLAQTIALLHHMRLLYPAFKKCRILTFPPITSRSLKRSPDQITDSTPSPSPSQIAAFNTLINSLLGFSEKTDEIAEALYASDAREVKKQLIKMKKFAAEVVDGARLDWNSGADKFSEWIDRWKAKLNEMDMEDVAVIKMNEKDDLPKEMAKADIAEATTSVPSAG